LRELVIGLVAGLVATGLVVLILVVTGSVSLALSPDLRSSLGALPFFLVIFTLAAAVEEFIFRGYPLQAFAEGSRRWIAGVLLCLPFTLGHANNPDVTMIGVANIFLASVILVILYFQTRRLWLPITFHLSWNLAQSWLWGFDVSGIKIESQLFVTTQTGLHRSAGVVPRQADLASGCRGGRPMGPFPCWFWNRPRTSNRSRCDSEGRAGERWRRGAG
jgi:membrane protease YdiL (CAAX protease family)